jgi:hypothetical protein
LVRSTFDVWAIREVLLELSGLPPSTIKKLQTSCSQISNEEIAMKLSHMLYFSLAGLFGLVLQPAYGRTYAFTEDANGTVCYAKTGKWLRSVRYGKMRYQRCVAKRMGRKQCRCGV